MRRRILITLALMPSLVFGASTDGYYTGIKATKRHFSFKSGYGATMFGKNFNQVALIGGLDLNKWLDLEIEAFSTLKSKQLNATVPFGATELGVNLFSGLGSDSYLSKTKLIGSSLQLMAHRNIIRNLRLFLGAGVSVVKMRIKADMILNDDLPAIASEKAENKIFESKTRLLTLLSGGLDWRIAKHLGMRADVAWENTSKLHIAFQTPASKPNTYHAKPNNSLVYGLAVYLHN